MALRRTASRVLHRTAGVDATAYWKFQPQERVITVEGFTGTVDSIEDGPYPDTEKYIVTLDAGMGGGQYGASELRAVPSTTAATEAALPIARLVDADMRGTAAESYPELSDVLVDRPPLQHAVTAARSSAPTSPPGWDGAAPIPCNHFEADFGEGDFGICKNCWWARGAHSSAAGGPTGHGGFGPEKTGKLGAVVAKDYEGQVGNSGHITRKEDGTLPLSAIAHLAGVKGEVPGDHRNKQGQVWEDFKEDIRTNGIQSAIFITVDYREEPKISEGNHRRDAAVELGLDEVPVEIKYFGHAEQQGTVAERAAKTAKVAFEDDLDWDDKNNEYVTCNRCGGHGDCEFCGGTGRMLADDIRAFAGWQVVDENGAIHAGPFPNSDQADAEVDAEGQYVERVPDEDFAEPFAEASPSYTTGSVVGEGQSRPESRSTRVVGGGVGDASEQARTADAESRVAGMAEWFGDKMKVTPYNNYSFDWCRFRKQSRCFYPKELDPQGTQQAGYAVWKVEDRGYCPRESWDNQKACPVGEPGPHSGDPRAKPDATVSWEEGGQRAWASLADVPVVIRPRAQIPGVGMPPEPIGEQGTTCPYCNGVGSGGVLAIGRAGDLCGKCRGRGFLDMKFTFGGRGASLHQADVTFTEEGLYTMLGEVALPPYPDGQGGVVDAGSTQDCAPIASHLQDKVQQYRIARGGLNTAQVCKYCKNDATKAFLWAEGMAYIPACDEHHDKARSNIVDENHDEVISEHKLPPRKGVRRGDGTDTCTVCGSDDLHGTEGTEEYPDQWVIICNSCGHIQGKRRKQAAHAMETSDILRPGALDDHEWDFHFTAAWKDVRDKASRIRSDGHVRIISATEGYITAEIRGDSNIYQTTIMRAPGRKTTAMWECGCAWSNYSWGRSGRWKKYEGRMCSHALALVFEAQSREFGGGAITEDRGLPQWRNDPTVPVVRPGDNRTKPTPWRVGSKVDDLIANLSPGYLVESEMRELGIAALEETAHEVSTDASLHISLMGALLHEAGFVGDLKAKVRGVVRRVLDVIQGQVQVEGIPTPVPAYEVLYPTWHPTAGLDPRDLTASLKIIADANSSGVMVCLVPPENLSKQMLDMVTNLNPDQLDDVEKLEQAHITLAYLGDKEDNDRDKLERLISAFAHTSEPLSGHVGGFGVFHNGDKVAVALWDIPGLPEWRQKLCDFLNDAGCKVADNHGFTPHQTLMYSGEANTPKVPDDAPEITSKTVDFSSFCLSYGDDWLTYPMGGTDDGAPEQSEQKAASSTTASFWDLQTERGRERANGEDTCELCGRTLNPDTAQEVEVDLSGRPIPPGHPDSGGPESQGAWIIGPECMKKVRKLPPRESSSDEMMFEAAPDFRGSNYDPRLPDVEQYELGYEDGLEVGFAGDLHRGSGESYAAGKFDGDMDMEAYLFEAATDDPSHSPEDGTEWAEDHPEGAEAVLHDEPEPALPIALGDEDEESVEGDDAVARRGRVGAVVAQSTVGLDAVARTTESTAHQAGVVAVVQDDEMMWEDEPASGAALALQTPQQVSHSSVLGAALSVESGVVSEQPEGVGIADSLGLGPSSRLDHEGIAMDAPATPVPLAEPSGVLASIASGDGAGLVDGFQRYSQEISGEPRLSGLTSTYEGAVTTTTAPALGTPADVQMPAWLNPMGGDSGAGKVAASRAANVEIAGMAKLYLAEGQEGLTRVAMKAFTQAEQRAIINEGANERAGNLDQLDLTGTHYGPIADALEDLEDDEGWLY